MMCLSILLMPQSVSFYTRTRAIMVHQQTSRRELAAGLATAVITPWQSVEAQPTVMRADVAVIGANGRTGGAIVEYCVATGRAVRACSRHAQNDAESSLVTSITADVTKPETLAGAVVGAQTVIFAATAPAFGKPSAVDHVGLESTARACIAASVPHLVVISGAGITKLGSPAYRFLNRFGQRMDAKREGEASVRAMYATAHLVHNSAAVGVTGR
jgi:uncharacterized protein YbjT (DUF2867 family)